MTDREFNGLVAAAARNQPLQGVKRTGTGTGEHHWTARVEKVATDPLAWRVFIGPGAVNDNMAAINYLRTGDRRGWIMPPDHPAIPEMVRVYGPNFKVVERKLTETADPPHLLVFAPDLAGKGDFRRVKDEARVPFFRSAAMWELDLWTASVFLFAGPTSVLSAENQAHAIAARPATRFLLSHAPDLPRLAGAQGGGFFELARLYLTRDPADLSKDTLYAEQRCYWSLQTTRTDPNPFAGNAGSEFAANAADANPLNDSILAAASALFDSAATVEFWTA